VTIFDNLHRLILADICDQNIIVCVKISIAACSSETSDQYLSVGEFSYQSSIQLKVGPVTLIFI